MIIFAVESSTKAASAALLCDDTLVAESYADVGLTHSQTLMVLTDEVFRRASLSPADVDCFAVTDGPGSFTGLRIGMAVIKGLALGTDRPCVAVSVLEALARNVMPTSRKVVAVCDAKRERVYHAAFCAKQGVLRLCEDGVVEMSELSGMYREQQVLWVGDAAQMCYNKLQETVDGFVAPAERRLPRASAVAACAAKAVQKGKTVCAENLVPRYIQLSQAEREKEGRER